MLSLGKWLAPKKISKIASTKHKILSIIQLRKILLRNGKSIRVQSFARSIFKDEVHFTQLND